MQTFSAGEVIFVRICQTVEGKQMKAIDMMALLMVCGQIERSRKHRKRTKNVLEWTDLPRLFRAKLLQRQALEAEAWQREFNRFISEG